MCFCFFLFSPLYFIYVPIIILAIYVPIIILAKNDNWHLNIIHSLFWNNQTTQVLWTTEMFLIHKRIQKHTRLKSGIYFFPGIPFMENIWHLEKKKTVNFLNLRNENFSNLLFFSVLLFTLNLMKQTFWWNLGSEILVIFQGCSTWHRSLSLTKTRHGNLV